MASKYYEGETFDKLSFSGREFSGLTLVDCDFSGCVFEGCRIVRCLFTECRFTDCRISDPKLDYSEAKFTILEDCRLTGVNWGLLMPGNGFGEPIDKLVNCRMKYNFFTEMDLRRFKFAGSVLDGCTFADCKLTESDFSDCALGGTEFFRCDLTGADFRKASGYRIDVLSCPVKRARFTLPEAADLLYSLGIKLE